MEPSSLGWKPDKLDLIQLPKTRLPLTLSAREKEKNDHHCKEFSCNFQGSQRQYKESIKLREFKLQLGGKWYISMKEHCLVVQIMGSRVNPHGFKSQFPHLLSM